MTDLPPSFDPPDVKRRRESRVLGMIVMTMSGMVAGLCGLCTLAFVGGTGGSGSAGDFYGLIALVLGGIPTAVGIAGFVAGLTLYRSGGGAGDLSWINPKTAEGRHTQALLALGILTVIALLQAVSRFKGEVLFGVVAFFIGRWMNGVDAAAPDLRASRRRICGIALTALGVVALMTGEASFALGAVGLLLAIWVYRGGGRDWLGVK